MDGNRAQRKACDLCYRKRIKCDAQKPRCSQCVVYDAACTYVAASRKAAPRRPGPDSTNAALQSRVESLEAELKRLSARVEQLARPAAAQAMTEAGPLAPEIEDVPQRAGMRWHLAARDLPPLHDVLPIVEGYLAAANADLPLFHPVALLDTVKAWYWFPEARDAKAWATINVVLALAFRTNAVDAPDPARSAAEHVNNAQAVLTELIMGETDLASVQVLLGLTMLFQGSPDLGPPTILIATAIRLAHRLELHTRRGSAHVDRRQALQRCRVFWIAYIIDRDISVRIRRPPVQNDADIDLDLPADTLGDDPDGPAFLAHGLSAVNYFRTRIQLARIQGRVYDALLSVRAQNASDEERAQSMLAIGNMLDGWMATIPHEFHPCNLANAGPLALSRSFCVLYSGRLMCLCMINQAHPWNSVWMEELQDYGRRVAAAASSPPPLPPGWQTLVNDARDYMRLFVTVPRKDAPFIWLTVCAYVSSLMCLMANIIRNPHDLTVASDMELADAALQFLDTLATHTKAEMSMKIRDTCTELITHARSMAKHGGAPRAPAPSLFLADEAFSRLDVETPSSQALGNSPPELGSLEWSWDLRDGGTGLGSLL